MKGVILKAMLAGCLVAVSSTPIVMAAQPIGTSMVVGSITSQPIGHYEFCKRNRENAVEAARGPRRRASPNSAGPSCTTSMNR